MEGRHHVVNLHVKTTKKNIALRLVYIVQSYGCEDPPKHLGKRTNFPQLPSGNQQLKTSLVWRFPSHVWSHQTLLPFILMGWKSIVDCISHDYATTVAFSKHYPDLIAGYIQNIPKYYPIISNPHQWFPISHYRKVILSISHQTSIHPIHLPINH